MLNKPALWIFALPHNNNMYVLVFQLYRQTVYKVDQVSTLVSTLALVLPQTNTRQPCG